MAEVLGVVGSSVSIVAFAIQVSEKITQIRSFLDAVKSAPVEIQRHLEDIQFLNDILLDLDSQNPSGFGDRTRRRCMERCRQAAELTSELLNELQAKVRKRRMRGSAEFALKRGELDRLLSQLERIKTTLSMAHMVTQNRHQAFMMERLDDRVQTLIAQNSSNTASTSSSSSCFPVANPHQRKWGKPALRLALPTWLSGKVWEIYTAQAQMEWAFRLRTYNVIPEDSPIFEYAKTGNVNGLDSLLKSNEASIFDCAGDMGSTALHVAALSGQTAAVNLLLDRGADPCATTSAFKHPTPLLFTLLIADQVFQYPSGPTIKPIDSNLKDLILRLIPKTEDIILERAYSFLTVANDEQILQRIMATLHPPFYQRPLSERIDLIDPWTTHICIGRRKPELIPLILTTDERKSISLYRQQVLPMIVYNCARTSYYYPNELSGYHALLVNVFRGYPQRSKDPPFCSPPQSLLVTFLRLWLRACGPMGESYWFLQEGRARAKDPDINYTPIRILTRVLYAANVDLLQLGKKEARLLTRGLVDQDMETKFFPARRITRVPTYYYQEHIIIRLIGFSYGPKPEDWHCWYSDFRDEHAGEFWDMVENAEPEMPIPGSWVD